jgi:hypothetical protein
LLSQVLTFSWGDVTFRILDIKSLFREFRVREALSRYKQLDQTEAATVERERRELRQFLFGLKTSTSGSHDIRFAPNVLCKIVCLWLLVEVDAILPISLRFVLQPCPRVRFFSRTEQRIGWKVTQ